MITVSSVNKCNFASLWWWSFFSNLQDMTSAVITYCGHFFHGICLRKWLYVQESCPMCHSSIKPSSAKPKAAADEAPPTHHHPPPSEQPPSPDTHQQEEQGSQADSVYSAETNCDESDNTNSVRTCSKESLQHLHCGSNGDSEGVANSVHFCLSDGDPEVASQELREADWKVSSVKEACIREAAIWTRQTDRGKTQSKAQRKWEALKGSHNSRGLQRTVGTSVTLKTFCWLCA